MTVRAKPTPVHTTEVPAIAPLPGGALRYTLRHSTRARGLRVVIHPERGVDMLRRGPGTDDQQVRLVGVPGIADPARDHAQPGVTAEEPAADPLDAAQRLHAVTDVHAHLGLLVHQRDRTLAIAAVQLLEEVFHRLDSTHARSVASAAHGRRCSPPRPACRGVPPVRPDPSQRGSTSRCTNTRATRATMR